MHLTRFTDLSLRVLIYLTHNERKGLVTVTELAERFKWSRNHMVKVVHFMSTKNWVQTHRGGSVRISVSGEVIPGAAQRGCPLFFVMQYARPDAIARVV